MDDSEFSVEGCLGILGLFGVIFLIGAIPYWIMSITHPEPPKDVGSHSNESDSGDTPYKQASESQKQEAARKLAREFPGTSAEDVRKLMELNSK